MSTYYRENHLHTVGLVVELHDSNAFAALAQAGMQFQSTRTVCVLVCVVTLACR